MFALFHKKSENVIQTLEYSNLHIASCDNTCNWIYSQQCSEWAADLWLQLQNATTGGAALLRFTEEELGLVLRALLGLKRSSRNSVQSQLNQWTRDYLCSSFTLPFSNPVSSHLWAGKLDLFIQKKKKKILVAVKSFGITRVFVFLINPGMSTHLN